MRSKQNIAFLFVYSFYNIFNCYKLFLFKTFREKLQGLLLAVMYLALIFSFNSIRAVSTYHVLFNDSQILISINLYLCFWCQLYIFLFNILRQLKEDTFDENRILFAI